MNTQLSNLGVVSSETLPSLGFFGVLTPGQGTAQEKPRQLPSGPQGEGEPQTPELALVFTDGWEGEGSGGKVRPWPTAAGPALTCKDQPEARSSQGSGAAAGNNQGTHAGGRPRCVNAVTCITGTPGLWAHSVS